MGGSVGRGIAGDLAFDQGTLSAPDSSGFAGAIDVRYGGRLPIIDPNEVARQLTPQSERKFDVRYQTETARKELTLDDPILFTVS